MFPVPDASLPAVDICSERSAAGYIFCPFLTYKIREKDHLQAVRCVRVVVYDSRRQGDELDDQFCHEVAGGRLAAEYNGPGRSVDGRIVLQPPVKRNDVQDIQVLPLVFVDALRLNIKDGFNIDSDAGPLLDEAGKVRLFASSTSRHLLLNSVSSAKRSSL